MPDAKTEQSVGRLVDKIIAAKSKDSEAVTEALEKQIDALFYELYGANQDDIRRIEELAEASDVFADDAEALVE